MAKRTPLYDWHLAHGAKTIEFGGWDMPVYYSAILAEHAAVRERAGLFDLCHMGRISIVGRDAVPFVQRVFSNDVLSLDPDQARYGLICLPTGGAIDDVIFYRVANGFLLVPNASNKDAIVEWLHKVRDDERFDVTLTDISDEIGMVALQGPLAIRTAIAAAALAPVSRSASDAVPLIGSNDLSKIGRFRSAETRVAGIACRVARTGYTGEDGFEFFCDAEELPALCDALLEAGASQGVVPAGLGARDSLRIEAALPLYGHELGRDMLPIHAGLSRFIDLEGPDFIGKKAMVEAAEDKSAPQLAGFEMLKRSVPREGCEVRVGGVAVGRVSSGVFSPTLDKGIGMAFITPPHEALGTEIEIVIRDKPFPARVVKRPFYTRPAQKTKTA